MLKERKDKLDQAKSKLDQMKGAKDEIDSLLHETKGKIRDTYGLIKRYEYIKKLFEKLGTASRASFISRIEGTVTKAIQETMEDNSLQFRIVFDDEKNNKAEFKLIDEKTNQELDIVNSFGGSVVHIDNVVLRVMFAEILEVRGPLIFDEPGTFIARENRENFGKFLKVISKELNRQILVVSHASDIIKRADKKLVVYKDGAVSKVTEE